jgi:hypothetical protein
MTAPQATVPVSKSVRMIYGAMVFGVLIFGAIGPIAFRQKVADSGALPDSVVNILVGASLAASIVGFLLRRLVPRRSVNDSADLFWTTAASRALIPWTLLEGGCLVAIIAWSLSGSLAALGVGGIGLLLLLAVNPWFLEKA